MRREGFELQVGAPQVIFHEVDGKKQEPIEHVVMWVPEETSGSIMEMLGKRKGICKNMSTENGTMSMEFDVPTR